ncbi:MAG: hypothetical protein A2X22_10500 [Bacteroidetes bacterium GWF2_49_14]|nr:MAG: hypothetical protein A2X22_10500 [Bacteroidetes bacterium GWF2_49_14]HBB92436.1 hypothetical protein [Bacteroidales bacterium]
MAKRFISILVSFSVLLGSIGIHVIEHHCIGCGGDRLEIVSVGLPESHADSCCGEESTNSCSESHHCEDDNCCFPSLLTLHQGLTDDEGISLIKATVKGISFAPAVLEVFAGLVPLENTIRSGSIGLPGLIHSRHSAGYFPYRC